eukprot:SAG31_NODE_320_length_17748_cov_4.201881_5_plen_61_part_00
MDIFVAYTRAFDRLLAAWDAGRLDVMTPASQLMPYLAMYKLMTWSRARGEALQRELIGWV